MKKIMSCLFMLLAASCLAGCGKRETERAVFDAFESDSAYVADKGELVVGVTDFEPLDYKENGEWIGFDAEMAELFAGELGVYVQFVEIDWNRKTELLNDGTIDCVWNGMTLNDELQNEMLF